MIFTHERHGGQTQTGGPETEKGEEKKERTETMKWKNWFTTLSGLLAGLPTIINQITPILPPKWAAILSALGVILTGLSAKDFNETGK
jgi:hypothetical protein